jgi:FkbM family methyltransferase
LLEHLIYDVGMNDGTDTAYYLQQGFSVVAIEADPVLAEQASGRFAREISDGRLKIINIAISDKAGVQPFWICETKSGWNSFNRSIASRDGCPHHQIDVRCNRLDTIFAQEGVPYYLKIDIEGNDALCVNQLSSDYLPKYISFEAGDRLEPIHRLRELGYTHFKWINQDYFIPLELPPIKEERHYQYLVSLLLNRNIILRVARRCGATHAILNRMDRIRQEVEKYREVNGWSFSGETSGPFGEHTPGRWQRFDEICKAHQHYHNLQKQGRHSLFWHGTSFGIWSDVHARLGG